MECITKPIIEIHFCDLRNYEARLEKFGNLYQSVTDIRLITLTLTLIISRNL
jgi:hypothetical protein